MHGDSMEWFPESKDNLPLTWWKQQPVYLAAVLALGGVASMVLTALLMALNQRSIGYLVFSVDNVAQDWRVWTPFTYVLVNRPGLMFLLSSYLFWSFGEAIERHLGRRSFVKLVLSLVLVTPLLLGLLALFGPRGWSAEGMGHLEFGVFLAFAALYPTARISIIILTIEAWVMATAIVAVDALSCLSRNDWAGLLILAGQVAMAVGYIRYAQGRLQMPALRLWAKPRPKLAVMPRPRQTTVKRTAVIEAESLEGVDAILDKISHQGMASLTVEEKRTLEKASEKLSKRGKRGP